MANKLTLTDIDNILDNHIETSIDFLMVVDHGLASYISEYLGETYDLIDETNDLSPYTKEYYISMLFDDEEIQMFCDYKYSDFFDSYGDYYIFTDMDRETVDKTLVGNASWSFCELVEDKEIMDDTDVENENVDEYLDDDNTIPCPCVHCKSARGEFTDDEEYEIGLVEHYAQYIENSECECGCELRNILYSMLQECMSMGYENAKDEIDEESDNEDGKIVNIHIDNIHFPNVTNKNELIESFSKLHEFAMKYAKI